MYACFDVRIVVLKQIWENDNQINLPLKKDNNDKQLMRFQYKHTNIVLLSISVRGLIHGKPLMQPI